MDLNVVLAVASLLLFVALLGYFGFIAYHQQQIEPEEKPATGVELLRQHYEPGDTVEQPTPYWVAPIPSAPDPLEIAGNLDRKIVAGGVMVFAMLGLVGGYLLLQIIPSGPLSLRAAAADRQLDHSIERGKNLYANFCFDCHGKQGLGSGEMDKDGEPMPGKPLNNPAFKHETLQSDPAKLKTTEDFLRLTISRGKQNPPPMFSMPAWADTEGGPFNKEQVTQLVNFIIYGTAEDWADIVTIRAHLEGSPSTEPDPGDPPARPTGAAAAQVYCTVCHTFDPNGRSQLPTAPNLGRYGVEGPINDELKRLRESDPDWLFKWVSNAPKIKPGVAMPPWLNTEGGTLDEQTVRTIVEYLQGLGK